VPDNREEEKIKNPVAPEFKSTIDESQLITNLNAKPEAPSNELLEQKQRVIDELQKEIRRLEKELGDLKVRQVLMQGRLVNEPAQKPKPAKVQGFETWQLIAVVLVAIFFGYFIASK
jgi:hypothetical protein